MRERESGARESGAREGEWGEREWGERGRVGQVSGEREG